MVINGAMGAFSLFPLVGRIEKLRGFYLPRLRAWYITFSTIFSLVIYFRIQYFFDDFERFPLLLSPEFTALMAMISLFIYIGVLVTIKSTFPGFPSKKKALYVIITMLFYFIMVGNLTCTFNVLENLREYKIISGTVTMNGQEIENTVKIEINIPGVPQPELPRYTKSNGSFFFILTREKYKKVNTIRFVLEAKGIASTFGPEDFPKTSRWKINLE
jgi:hypothetical protein